jgi:hypothetical protein
VPHVKALEDLLVDREDFSICGVILAVVLQGSGIDPEFERIRDLFLFILALMYSKLWIRNAYRKHIDQRDNVL